MSLLRVRIMISARIPGENDKDKSYISEIQQTEHSFKCKDPLSQQCVADPVTYTQN